MVREWKKKRKRCKFINVCQFLLWLESSDSVIFWPSARAKCHSRWCTGRKWHIPMAVMWGNRMGGNWLMKWDELKNSHGTLIDWCTGREWPLNCMTVISAWWRLSIWFQRLSGRRTIIYFSWVRRARGVASRVPDSWRWDVVGKATPDREGPREPQWSLGSREDADEMQ